MYVCMASKEGVGVKHPHRARWLGHWLTLCLVRVSLMCPGPPGKGQDGLQRPLRHCPGGQDQEEDQDHLWEPQPRLGGEL